MAVILSPIPKSDRARAPFSPPWGDLASSKDGTKHDAQVRRQDDQVGLSKARGQAVTKNNPVRFNSGCVGRFVMTFPGNTS
jgi:hypothetical protein